MHSSKTSTTGRLINDPYLVLWKVSREIPNVIVKKMLKLTTWNAQVVYLASQLDLICRITSLLEADSQKITTGTFLQIRILMEAVSNAIAGSRIVEYAESELEMLRIPRQGLRVKSTEQRAMLIMHRPNRWIYAHEVTPMWNKCNSILRGDSDTGFYLRNVDLYTLDIRSIAFTMLSFVEGIKDYLESIDCFYTPEEWARLDLRIKEALNNVPTTDEIYKVEGFHPFEHRLYKELVQLGLNLPLS